MAILLRETFCLKCRGHWESSEFQNSLHKETNSSLCCSSNNMTWNQSTAHLVQCCSRVSPYYPQGIFICSFCHPRTHCWSFCRSHPLVSYFLCGSRWLKFICKPEVPSFPSLGKVMETHFYIQPQKSYSETLKEAPSTNISFTQMSRRSAGPVNSLFLL